MITHVCRHFCFQKEVTDLKPNIKQKTTSALLALDQTIRDTDDTLHNLSDTSLKMARLHGALVEANESIRKILAMPND